MTSYREFHRRSIADREGFWAEQAQLIDWHRPFDAVLDYSKPPFAQLPEVFDDFIQARVARRVVVDVNG